MSLDIALEVGAEARTLVGGEEIPVTVAEGRFQLRLPRFDAFEVIVIGAPSID